MNTKISSEVEILCNQADCGLIKPFRMAVMKDKMYVLEGGQKKLSVFEGTVHQSFGHIFSVCVWFEIVVLISSKFIAYDKKHTLMKAIIKLVNLSIDFCMQ